MKRILLTAVLMVFCYCFSPSANAQPGTLDLTFGYMGQASPSTPYQDDYLMLLKCREDGKVFKSVMNIDDFDRVGGWVTIIDGSTGGYLYADDFYVVTRIEFQKDQKIITYGQIWDNNFPIHEAQNLLTRFNPNGKVDSTFGVNGRLYFMNFDSVNYNPIPWNPGATVLVRPNGKILLGLQDGSSLQLLANGQVDSTYGNAYNGYVGMAHPPAYLNVFFDYHPLVNDKLLLTRVSSTKKLILARLNPNGFVDSTFGTNGFDSAIVVPGITGFRKVSTDSNGNLFFAASIGNGPSPQIVLMCLDSTGSLKTSFGTGGKTLISVSGTNKVIASVNIQKNGKILLTGSATIPAGRKNYFLTRFNKDGTIDSSFGKKGESYIEVYTSDPYSYPPVDTPIGILEGGYSVLQPNGKIFLSAGVYDSYHPGRSAAVARCEGDDKVYYNSLVVSPFFDKNYNGIKDPGEYVFPYGDAVAIKAGVDTIHSMFGSWEMSMSVDTGTYVSQFNPYSSNFTTVPASHTTSFPAYFSSDTATFAVQPIPGKRDLSINSTSFSGARPGFIIGYQVKYQNTGTDTADGTVEIIKSNKMNFNSATPPPTSVSGDTLRWAFTNFKPFEPPTTIYVLSTVQTQPLVNLGDTLIFVTTITSNKTDLHPADNTSTSKVVVTASFDPNDKTENHGGSIKASQVAAGEYLQYTIRFQNTGNDTAFNVYIRDTLDGKLDWNTMQIVASSHNYQMTINDGKCFFTFPRIQLVDSIHNEPQSHGYIVYKVKPKPTVALGDTIKNTAAIYFDYNLPIHTNTETTLIISEVLPLRLVSFIAKKENKTNLLNWTTTNEINVDHFEIERSNNGREFNKIGIVSSELSAGSIHKYSYTDHSPLTAHNSLFYRLKIIDKDGKFEYSPIRMISNNTDGQISIYPNPARDKVTITHPATNTVTQLQITDMTGRILRRTTVAISAVQTNINIKGLSAGKYNITWSNGAVNNTQVLVIE